MQKIIDDMQISINEKEAEIIRLSMCLGDEKKKFTDLQNVSSTPTRKRGESQSRSSL